MELKIEYFESEHGPSVQLINPLTKEKAVILPELGATLVALHLKTESGLNNIIYIPGSTEIATNNLHPSAILAPWVNRVRNGNYSFEGKNHQLPINEIALGNSIHGFLARRPFNIVSEIANSEFAEIKLANNYAGDFEGFPFNFSFQVSYRLNAKGKFDVNFSAENTGKTNMPFACGWHPYFTFPGSELSDCSILFSGKSRFISDSQMIPMQEEIVHFTEPLLLAKEKSNHVFRLNPKETHITEFKNLKKNQTIIIQQSSTDFPFLVVFVPDNHNCLAIEPMSGNTDAFNTLDGLVILSAGAKFDSTVGIWLKEEKMNEV